MRNYIFRRSLTLVGIMVGILVITFFLTRVLPSSPVEMMLGAKPTAEQIAIAKQELGLDKPLWHQFVSYISQAATGDFGKSLRTGQEVKSEIIKHMMATIELVTIAIGISLCTGIPLGVWAAIRNKTPVDQMARGVSIVGIAIPSFFLAILLQMLFYGVLNWFPLQGRIDSHILIDAQFTAVTGLFTVDTLLAGDWVAFKSAVQHLALPVLTLSLATFAIFVRTTRNLMVEVLSQDYIRTGHAFGLSHSKIYFFYALKATLVPLLTVIGLTYGFMLGNSVIVESIFDWPGIGRYVVESVITNDFPAVMGVTLILSSSYLLVNFVIDLLYFTVDPRLSPEV
ncbi:MULTISPECIES: ABC transporter permease [Vibrio]|uniref:ABC transporter permease n=1 Tax=Vibrio barjaei TaxID=1676683 RepID=A0ABW7IKL1_9VIBR|nr:MULTISPECIES: ABC transporter permease [Vibrio]KFA95850.1 peptide ABC transporter permease [Vibrio sp. ER1A]MCG9786205.1 ABC transporter permease [Vibrio mediterranei]MCY9872214.1 ABC transporter permease [Vibrio barjaei]NOI24026.1 ABC transporter permease [Vibrio mediterranei]OIN28637.1 peptide ABC transporter permease [Vibrio barjaei]